MPLSYTVFTGHARQLKGKDRVRRGDEDEDEDDDDDDDGDNSQYLYSVIYLSVNTFICAEWE